MVDSSSSTSKVSSAAYSPDTVDLATLMFSVQAARADILDGQVRTQIQSVQEKNSKLREANAMMAKLRTDSSGATDNNATPMSQELLTFYKDNGIAYDTTGGDTSHNKNEWQTNKENLQGYIDNLTSTSQLDMASLQSTMSKYNQSFETLSNFIAKYYQSLDQVTAKLAG